MEVAVLDACVLYPAPLRDLLLWLVTQGLFSPRWTEAIHEEWMRSLLADRPDIQRSKLERTRRLMDEIDPKSLVVAYEDQLSSITLPDPNDRHVLAAARAANSPTIVTFNLSDFPAAALKPFGVRAAHPNMFVVELFEAQTELFLSAVQRHRASLRQPPKTPDDYVATLAAQGLPTLADRLLIHLNSI
jgi:hypothetical protein